MSCRHQMDQTLTTRETPSLRMRVFCSNWGSWSVFWLRWYRLRGSLAAAGPGLSKPIREAGGCRGGRRSGLCSPGETVFTSPGSRIPLCHSPSDHSLPGSLHSTLASYSRLPSLSAVWRSSCRVPATLPSLINSSCGTVLPPFSLSHSTNIY